MIRSLALLALALTPLVAHAQDGWFLFRGNPQRTGVASSMAAWPKRPAWQRPLLNDKVEGLFWLDDDEPVINLIEKLREGADPTILPGFFPLIVDGVCVYRNHRQACAVTMKGHELRDELTGQIEKYKPSEIVWMSIPMASSLAEGVNHVPRSMAQWVPQLQAQKQDTWLWTNPLIGSMNSDGKEVFAINDIRLPPDAKPPVLFSNFKWLNSANDLQAYNAACGKLHWEIGHDPKRGGPMGNTCFLGVPLPLDGKRYAMSEKTAELRLISFSGKRENLNERGQPTADVTLSLTKIPAAERIQKSPLRRTQPLHIAEANGLLVCPTHLGVLFGVYRAKMAIRWRYEYRDQKIPVPSLPFWQAAGPIIAQNRIVFTAADAPQIHCLDLDGKKQWIAAKDDDLYLATVHDDLVLLVGKTHCRALNLADGKEKWKLEMGLSAGVGVLDGSLYYLPLKRDAVTKGPTLWAIDLAKGKKAHRLEMPYPDALGNLALHRGMFVSQSVTHVAAFPLAAKAP